MSRNCFPITAFILLLAVVIVAGVAYLARNTRKNFEDITISSSSNFLLGLFFVGIISMVAFLIYSLTNVFPC